MLLTLLRSLPLLFDDEIDGEFARSVSAAVVVTAPVVDPRLVFEESYGIGEYLAAIGLKPVTPCLSGARTRLIGGGLIRNRPPPLFIDITLILWV